MKELSRSILRWLGLSALLLLCPVLICAAADAPPQNRYETVAGLDIVQADMEENRAGSEKTQADAEDVQANTEAAKANTEDHA